LLNPIDRRVNRFIPLAGKRARVESQQDAIEFELGRDTPVPPGSRRWSGMP
jgi:hypothetical protein